MRYLLGYGSLAAMVFALTACGDDEPAATDSTPTAAASPDGAADSATADPTPADDADTGEPAAQGDCPDNPVVTVLDPGAEPHQVMEVSPEVGDSAAVDMRMTQEMALSMNGQAAPAQEIPPMIIGMVTTVENVTDDRIEMSFGYDRAEAEGGDPAVNESLQALTTMSGTIVTTRTGEYVEGRINSDGLDPQFAAFVDQMEQQLDDMTLPLPGDPVGVGAEWEVSNSIESGGITFCNVASYRLADFDGDAYELDMEVTQEAVPTTIEQGGASIEVVTGSGSATGHSSGSLRLPLAINASTEATNHVEFTAEQGGTEVTQEMDMRITMELAPRD